MILTVNGNNYNIDIKKSFKVNYIRSIKFEKRYNGTYFVSDRGLNSDKYETEITIFGQRDKSGASIVDQNDSIISDLYTDTNTLTIDTEGLEVFGSGIDHSSPFECLYNVSKYPINNYKESNIVLKIRPVSTVTYKSTVTAQFPDLFYNFNIRRNIDIEKDNFDTLQIGDYGTSANYNNTSLATHKREILKFTAKLKDDDFAELHKYIATVLRGSSFTLPVTIFNPYLNGTSSIITGFTFRKTDAKHWDVNLTLVNQ